MAIKPFLLIACCACFVGCQFGPDQQLVGAWTTNRRLSKVPDMPYPEYKSRMQNGINATQLKLSADHTFMLTGLRQVGGKWSYSKGVLTLEPSQDSKFGQMKTIEEFRHLDVDADFDRMSVTIPLPFGEIVVVLDKTA